MLSRLDIIAVPSSLPVTLQTLKQQIRVDGDDDDIVLASLLNQVIELAQEYLARFLYTYTVKWTIARTEIPRGYQTPYYYGGAIGYDWMNYNYNNFHSIELPRNPVQQVLSVSQGYWGQSPDTFLTYGTDYLLDLASNPARLRLINWTTFRPDHLSVTFTTGFGQTSTINLSGTATAAGAITGTINGQGVSSTVAIGDTAQTAAANLLTAIQATSTYADLITPTMITLRADNPTVANLAAPAGLMATSTAPLSNIPASIQQAIIWRAGQLYQELSKPTKSDDSWFYRSLDNWRNFAGFA